MCKKFNNFVSVDKIAEKVKSRLSNQALRSSGLIFELFTVRYSDSVDEWIHQNPSISNMFRSYLTYEDIYIRLEERETEDEAVFGIINCYFCEKPLTLQEMRYGDACFNCILTDGCDYIHPEERESECKNNRSDCM
jgi:hypothetical protein